MPTPEPGIRLRSSARTSVGQVRENNEDTVHLWTRDDMVLAIVADGMGGAAAGEEASRIAVETIKSGFAQREAEGDANDNTLTEKLLEAIQTANQRIVQKAAHSPEMRGMGTTLTLALVRGTYAVFAHVGDSRAYWVDGADQSISQITSDHSFVQALVLAGHITQEQAANHPMGNVLYRALGQAEEIDVDMYYKRLHVGDRVVLCSDGLTRHVKPEEIAEIALSDPNPDLASQKLIDLANSRGGEDNVSVIVISVEDTGSLKPRRKAAIRGAEEDETLVLPNNPLRKMMDDDPTVTERGNAKAPRSRLDEETTYGESTLDGQKAAAEPARDSARSRRADHLPVTGPRLGSTPEGRDTRNPNE